MDKLRWSSQFSTNKIIIMPEETVVEETLDTPSEEPVEGKAPAEESSEVADEAASDVSSE